MITVERIKKLVESKLEDGEMFIVEVLVRPGNKILVYLDSDTSVTIADCVSISRFIEKSLDRDIEDFELEVSSAGFRPLKLQRQYVKNIGRNIKLDLKEGEKASGKLIKVDENELVIEVVRKKKEHEEVTIPFSEIERALVEPSFKK